MEMCTGIKMSFLFIFLTARLILHYRFVRREKELAESRFEVAQGESLRYRLRMEHLERELKEVQDNFTAAKERMQVGFLLSNSLTKLTDACVYTHSLTSVCLDIFIRHVIHLFPPCMSNSCILRAQIKKTQTQKHVQLQAYSSHYANFHLGYSKDPGSAR